MAKLCQMSSHWVIGTVITREPVGSNGILIPTNLNMPSSRDKPMQSIALHSANGLNLQVKLVFNTSNA